MQRKTLGKSGAGALHGAAPKFKKAESGRLALDESTVGRLLEIRRRAFSDNPEITISKELFSALLRNQNAAVSVMKLGGGLAGYVIANPIGESWVKGDLQEIKDVMKANMDGALYGKVSAAMESGGCYYLDDLAVAMRSGEAAGSARGPLSQLRKHTARFNEASAMVESFFSQLAGHGATFLVLHGRMSNGAYNGYTKRIGLNGYRKIAECVHPDWFGGEDFMLMVFEKA